jgi:GNAT superfamily N-acetyltransferase
MSSASLELREQDFASFFDVPFAVYGPASPYVSPMKSDLRRFLSAAKNPLFLEHGERTFFTAHRGGRPVGRIVAHVHEDSNRIHRLRRGYFGYFDCADDAEAAEALLGAAQGWASAHGLREIAGNFNLTAMQQLGVMTDGFGATPYTDMQFNPPHIPRLLEGNGFAPFFPMTTFEIDLARLDPALLIGERENALDASREVEWVPLRRRTFRAQMGDAMHILNEGFAANPMFVPLSRAEFMFQAQEMMWIVDDRIAMLAYERGEPAGIIICIPDLNQFVRDTDSRLKLSTPLHYVRHVRNRKRALLVFAGVRPAFQQRGLSGALMSRCVAAMKGAGYESLGITWVSDENTPSLRQVAKMGGQPLHRLHLYRKELH